MTQFEHPIPTWRHGVNWDAYAKTWVPLNRPFITQALQRLPVFTRPDPWIYLPGAGTAAELNLLHPMYPKARFITSDISSEMIPALRDNHTSLGATTRFHMEDAVHPAVDEVDMCVNSFMLHLVDNPTVSLKAMWKSLRPGGWFVSLYFPPVPKGDGPLAGLFWAVTDTLGGRIKPNWEEEALPWLMGKAARLTSAAVYAQWSFTSLDHFRGSMEILPQIRALKLKLGDDRYEQVWERWQEQPGLYPDQSDGWHGAAAARFILAQKPAKRIL
jgi:SAM-dependent methyltransferase